MGMISHQIGHWLARFLSKPTHIHSAAPLTTALDLRTCLQVADVILVEGNTRFSTAIKYLTQSTWSHAALYVGMRARHTGEEAEPCFIEADIIEGVRLVGLEEFAGYHTRICRPIGLDSASRDKVAQFALERIGHQYDLKNVIDLARYLIPTPPVPIHFRRKMLALGSGDPTRAICSTLIAQAFQSLHYPILPVVTEIAGTDPDCPGCKSEILQARDYSQFVPRDFDVSPYFDIIKPSRKADFSLDRVQWWHEGLS